MLSFDKDHFTFHNETEQSILVIISVEIAQKKGFSPLTRAFIG